MPQPVDLGECLRHGALCEDRPAGAVGFGDRDGEGVDVLCRCREALLEFELHGGLRPRELQFDVIREMDGVVDGAEGGAFDRSVSKPVDDIVGVAFRPHFPDVVYTHVPAESVALERLGQAAGNGVLFDDQHRVIGSRQGRGTGEAADAGADDDGVPRPLISCHATAPIRLPVPTLKADDTWKGRHADSPASRDHTRGAVGRLCERSLIRSRSFSPASCLPTWRSVTSGRVGYFRFALSDATTSLVHFDRQRFHTAAATARASTLPRVQQRRRPEGVYRLSFRATGITAHLANRGALKHAQATAAHESPRTTKLYDRTKERLTQDEVERCHIAAFGCLPQLPCRQLVGSGSTRARKSLTPALPYIARFSVFSRLMWPSVGPLLQLTVTAFLTASRSVAACARTAAWHRCRTGARP